MEIRGERALLVFFQNLRERKKAEAALKASEERFDAFMNNSPVVAFIKDEEGRMVYMNQKFEENISSASARMFIGKTDLDWLPPEIARSLMEVDQRVLASGEIVSGNRKRPHAGRGDLGMAGDEVSHGDERTGKKLLGGVAIDVGEQKDGERALQESERHFRELFDEAPVAYHELDLENRITRVNATELAMLGYTARGNGRAPDAGFHRR